MKAFICSALLALFFSGEVFAQLDHCGDQDAKCGGKVLFDALSQPVFLSEGNYVQQGSTDYTIGIFSIQYNGTGVSSLSAQVPSLGTVYLSCTGRICTNSSGSFTLAIMGIDVINAGGKLWQKR